MSKKREYEIIEELSNRHSLVVFFFTAIIIVLVTGGLLAGYLAFDNATETNNSLDSIKRMIAEDLTNFTPLGIFIYAFIGGFFFIPLPIEAFFSSGLANGNNPWVSLLLVMTGILFSQIINYWLGKRFSTPLMTMVSKKKVYKVRRWVNKYGAYAIFIFNVLPLPSPMLTFALGLVKYNPVRLAFWLVVGSLAKFLAIIGISALI